MEIYMELLEFDTYHIFDLQQLAKEAEDEWNNPNQYRDKDGYVYVKKIVDGKHQLRHPFSICDYFGVKYDLKRDGEFIWEKVEAIRHQVAYELGNLMTNGLYKLDWNENDDNSLGVFYKKEEVND